MDTIENAVSKFSQGYACSQAILSEYGEHFGLDTQTALRLAAGFAGGMRFGGTCGAVTGAIMVLGLRFSAQHCEKPEGRKDVYDAVRTLTTRFEEVHGSTGCASLLGCNIGTDDGMRKAKEENLFQTICPGLIATAAGLLHDVLGETR